LSEVRVDTDLAPLGHEPGPAVPDTTALPGVGSDEMSLGEGLRRGGTAIFVVLLIPNSLDELESAVLAVLAPDIRDTFGISDGAIVFISAASVAFTVLGAVPMGWLADRYRRGTIIGVSSVIFGALVFASGMAVNAFTLFCSRFGAGIAKANTLPVHGSLLADAYPIGVRGRMGAVTSGAGRLVGVLSAVLVGSIAAAVGGVDGWRWAYYLLGIPVAVVALAAFLLPEPPRGQWERNDVFGTAAGDSPAAADAGVGEAGAGEEASISIEAAFARLRDIRTLRTAVLGFAAIGFGLFTAPVLVNLFLEDRYDLDAGGRGLVASVGGLASLAILPFVGKHYDRLYRDDPARAVRLIGLLILPAGLLTPLQFQMPNAVLFTLLGLPFGVLLSAAFVMIAPLLQSIVPYRLRGLGASMGMLYIFLIGATGGALLAMPLIDAWDPAVAVPVLVVGRRSGRDRQRRSGRAGGGPPAVRLGPRDAAGGHHRCGPTSPTASAPPSSPTPTPASTPSRPRSDRMPRPPASRTSAGSRPWTAPPVPASPSWGRRSWRQVTSGSALGGTWRWRGRRSSCGRGRCWG
jgi:MFS family permease